LLESPRKAGIFQKICKSFNRAEKVEADGKIPQGTEFFGTKMVMARPGF
jgi:hypothetical protein